MAIWTQAEFIKNLRSRIDEPSPDYYSNDELISWMNEGIMDLGLELRLEDIFLQTLATPTKSVPLPVGCLSVRDVYVNGNRILQGNLENRSNSTQMVYLWGDNLYFTQAVQGDLEIFYIRQPKKLDRLLTDSTTDVPERFQHLVVEYGYSKAKEKDEEFSVAMAIMDEYLRKRAEMVAELRQRTQLEGLSFVNMTYNVGDQ